jgi:hypothetical protein
VLSCNSAELSAAHGVRPLPFKIQQSWHMRAGTWPDIGGCGTNGQNGPRKTGADTLECFGLSGRFGQLPIRPETERVDIGAAGCHT